MSDDPGREVCVLDTSALMDWHDRYYPSDVFRSLVVPVDTLIGQDRLISVELVHEEIRHMGSSALQSWVRQRANIFDPIENHLAQALIVLGRFLALQNPNVQFEDADAYVIALAQTRGSIVVTAETPAAAKRKPRRAMYIPDECAALGIAFISNLGMMRREHW